MIRLRERMNEVFVKKEKVFVIRRLEEACLMEAYETMN